MFGTVKADEYAWFSFKTGDDTNAIYNATFVDMTVKSDRLEVNLMDEYGTKINTSDVYAYICIPLLNFIYFSNLIIIGGLRQLHCCQQIFQGIWIYQL